MKAVVVEANKTLTLQEVDRPEVPPGGALIRVTGCGICGSDLDKLLHRDLPGGTVLGHEVVGVIDTLSSEAEALGPGLLPGQRVVVAHHVPCQQCHYCLHGSPSMCHAFKKSNIQPGGFSEWIAVTEGHLRHTVLPLPESTSGRAGSCIEPLACCLRAVDRIPNDVGTSSLVIGLGFIGLMTTQILQENGFTVAGLDINPDRAALAREHAMLTEAFTRQDELLEYTHNKTEGRGVDVVFLSVVNPATLDVALRAVRDGGTLVLFTSYGQNEPILSQNVLYFREISVITSYSPSLHHLQQAYDWIIQGRIQVEPLISHEVPLADLPQAMEQYRTGQALKVFVTL